MVNRTLPIPGDHGHYMVSIAVFHQLHCLVRATPSLAIARAPAQLVCREIWLS